MTLFADRIVEKNTKLQIQLYQSNWIKLIADPKIRAKFKALAIVFMKMNQIETPVLVGNLFPLNLKTFNTVSVIYLNARIFYGP